MVWIYALSSVFIISAISFIGALGLFLNKKKLNSIIFVMVSFSVGALLGDSLIHLLPEAFEELGGGIKTSLLVLLGLLIFFVLEKFIRWRHCHVSESKDHIHPVAFTNLIGDGVHNLIDGMLIGASFMISIPIGIATTIAVILHEIPQELGDMGVLLHSKISLKKALIFNFGSGLLAILGAVISLSLGESIEGYAATLLPITAGGFIYIAGSDLIPELHHETKPTTSLIQLLAIIAGIAVMGLLLFLE